MTLAGDLATKFRRHSVEADVGGTSGGKRRMGLAGLVLLVTPLPVLAAPFCVSTEALPPQCMFYDAALCEQRAQQLNGLCSVNRSEITVSPGLGHYCLLTSTLVSSCIYADRANCERDAKVQSGACVNAPLRPESPGADPYRDIRPSMVGR